MAQELPFLNFSEEDVKSLTPVDDQCTVLCEIEKIWAKENSKKDGTNVFIRFICIDDNSPQKGRPAIRSFPLGFPTMWAPLMMAVRQMDKDEIKAEAVDLQSWVGKQLYVKFDLRDNGNDQMTIQPVDYFRSDKPLAA